jgi:hypothetical protein
MVLSSKYWPRNIPSLDSGVGGNLRDCGGGEEDCGEAGGVKIPWVKVCMAKRNRKDQLLVDGKVLDLSGPNSKYEIWPFFFPVEWRDQS